MKALSRANDDVTVPHFVSARRAYLGSQRRGIVDDHPGAKSTEGLVADALTAPFFLAQEIPLPDSVKNAVSFLSEAKHAQVETFWSDQLSRLALLVKEAEPINNQWNSLIPSEIAPAAGKIKLAAFLSLMLHCGLGGSRWCRQFIFGFDLVGILSQSGTFPVDPRTEDERPLSGVKLLASATSRFRERSAASGKKNEKILWKEALEQQAKGWLAPPSLIDTASLASASPLNYAFRFGVAQGEKLRACDDLKHALTNRACIVRTPIKLVSWDHVAEVCRRAASSRSDWHFFKADHEAAYKQLPMKWEHSRLAVITLRCPTDGKWYAFRSRTMVFGAVAAVLHYNVFSRVLAELFTKLFGIPILSFFDDFGALIPGPLAKAALEAFKAFCELLGIRLKAEKEEVGPRVTFLGLRGFFPCRENGWKLQITLPSDKAKAWADYVRSFRQRGSIHALELETLIGRLSFSQTCLFGKFARTQMRCLYKKLHRRVYVAKFTPRELLSLRWWEAVLTELRPRVPRGIQRSPFWVLFTDAATKTNLMAAILFRGGACSSPRIQFSMVGSVPSAWLKRFHSRNKIYGSELLAVVAFVWAHAKLLAGKSVNLYIDSNNAIAALTRGDTPDDFLASLVSVFWKLAQAFSIDIWIGRVRSKLNIADLPTRHVKLPFPVKRSEPFPHLLPLMTQCLKLKSDTLS